MRLRLLVIAVPIVFGVAISVSRHSFEGAFHPRDVAASPAHIRGETPPIAATRIARDSPHPEQASLLWIDGIRKIPGAAELLDEILDYIKKSNDSSFSFENIPRGATGSFVLNDALYETMISDPVIRQKWLRLMKLIVENARPQERD